MPLKEKYYVHSADIYNRTSHPVNLKIFFCGENQQHEQEMIRVNKLEPNGGHFFVATRAYVDADRIVDKHIYKIQIDTMDGKCLELKWPFEGLFERHEKYWRFDIEENGIKSINPRL